MLVEATEVGIEHFQGRYWPEKCCLESQCKQGVFLEVIWCHWGECKGTHTHQLFRQSGHKLLRRETRKSFSNTKWAIIYMLTDWVSFCLCNINWKYHPQMIASLRTHIWGRIVVLPTYFQLWFIILSKPWLGTKLGQGVSPAERHHWLFIAWWSNR